MLIEEKLRNRLDSKSVKKHKLMRRFLRDYKVDLNKPVDQLHVLFFSVLNNDLKMFKILIEYGAVIDMRRVVSYIYLCIDNKNIQFLEYILKHIELDVHCVNAILTHEYIINKLGGKDSIINYVKSFPQLLEQHSNYDKYYKL